MTAKMLTAVVTTLAVLAPVCAADDVTVSGVTYPATIQRTIGEQTVKLRMTGAGVREKLLLGLYCIASYVDEGFMISDAAKAPEEIVAADRPKCLHLVMIRPLNGRDMADSFIDAVRLNHPAPAFQKELDQFAGIIRRRNAKRSDQIWLTYIRGVGVQCDFAGKIFMIRNPAFGEAVWNIYLGPKNLGEKLKRALISKL